MYPKVIPVSVLWECASEENVSFFFLYNIAILGSCITNLIHNVRACARSDCTCSEAPVGEQIFQKLLPALLPSVASIDNRTDREGGPNVCLTVADLKSPPKIQLERMMWLFWGFDLTFTFRCRPVDESRNHHHHHHGVQTVPRNAPAWHGVGFDSEYAGEPTTDRCH